MTIEIDRDHDIPLYSPVCTTCAHLHLDAPTESPREFNERWQP
jgi:hypothetical protein